MTQITNQPIDAETLRGMLRTGIVEFAFVKLDDSLRIVKGTVNLNHIPASAHPTGNGNPSERALRFYDFNKGGWRSLRIGVQVFLLQPPPQIAVTAESLRAQA